jgi:hypothetical protein
MRNSLARSLLYWRAHDIDACEKPWMNRISGPAGLPHSCAEIETPSGALTVSDLYFLSCATLGAEITTVKNITPAAGTRRRISADIMVPSSLLDGHRAVVGSPNERLPSIDSCPARFA